MSFIIFSDEVSRVLSKAPYRHIVAGLGGLLAAVALSSLSISVFDAFGLPHWFQRLVVMLGFPLAWIAVGVAISRSLVRSYPNNRSDP